MPSEQRKSRRVSCDVKVYFGNRGADHLGIVQDIAENSVRVRARKGFPIESRLQMRVEVPGQGMEPAKGLVKRLRKVQPPLPPHEPMEMGIVILESSKHLKDMIQKLLASFRDRRGVWRKETQLTAVLGNAQRLLEEFTQNIGDGGIFVVTENPAKIGDKLPARLKLPEPYGEISAECLVVHVVSSDDAALRGRLPGCGLRFLSFRKGDETKYEDYVRSLRGKDG